MTTIQDNLRLGASISRERNLNLDYAKIADEAADRIDALETEVLTWKICNDRTSDAAKDLARERDEYRKCADDMAAAHKVERDALRDALEELMEWQVKNVKVWNNSAYDNASRVMAQGGEK
jgi:hypothetical protein